MSGPKPALTKQHAADVVKGLIKPLYLAKQLSKEQFKAIAQACTHKLASAEGTAGRSELNVVQDCMKDLGLCTQALLL